MYLKYMIVFSIIFLSFLSFGKDKIFDLGAIDIKGELRRPNMSVVYSKKSFNKSINIIVNSELVKFEKELLKPKTKNFRKK